MSKLKHWIFLPGDDDYAPSQGDVLRSAEGELEKTFDEATSSNTQYEEKAREIVNWTVSEGTKDFSALVSAIASALRQAREEEREACAKIVESDVNPEWPNDDLSNQAAMAAARIRARSAKEG